MYYLTTALMYTHPDSSTYITFGEVLWRNLIPSTLGNIVGGGVFVAGISYMVYRERNIRHIVRVKCDSVCLFFKRVTPVSEDTKEGSTAQSRL